MKKIILISLFIILLTASFTVYAQNEIAGDSFDIRAADVSSIRIKYRPFGLPERGAYVLDDRELINSLLLQFESFDVVCGDEIIYEDTILQEVSLGKKDGYEISLNTSEGMRYFWISEDYKIVEYGKISGITSKFNYYFSNEEEISKWLEKTLDISKIWDSQKQNVLLSGSDDIKVYIQIDDIEMCLYFDAKPKIVNGRTMVPVRNVAEALGIRVSWNGEEQKVVLNREISIILHVGRDITSWTPYGNLKLDAATFIENNRVYVPLRFISEMYNTNVIYDSATKSIYLSKLIQDGWCIDYKGNYKVKIFRDYYFESRVYNKDYVDSCFTIPFGDNDSLSEPVKSIIRAGRLNMNIDDVLNSITSENSHREKFTVESVSQNEYFISFEYNELESENGLIVGRDEASTNYEYNKLGNNGRDEQRYVLMYLKQDGDTVLNAHIDCYISYFSKNKEDIIDNLKSITSIN